jgi:CBS domain-containing protein
MLKLAEVMTRDIITVSPELSIREAMELLADRHISGVPVVSGQALLGVVSSNDLLAFVASLPDARAAGGKAPAWTAVDEPDEYLNDADREDGPATYFTNPWADDRETDVRFGESDSEDWNVLDEHRVSDVMTRAPLWTLTPETSVQAAAAFMRRHGIHRVLVTVGTRLLGIVTTTDIMNAVAEHGLVAGAGMVRAGHDLDEQC